MYFDRFTLCDNIRVIELAAELHNKEAEMNLAAFIKAAVSGHLSDEHDTILALGSIAEIRLCPKDGEVELTTSQGASVLSRHLFYGIKDWDFAKLAHISDAFAGLVDQDIHRDPDEEGVQLYDDFEE